MPTHRAKEMLDPRGMREEHRAALDAEAEAGRDAIDAKRHRQALLRARAWMKAHHGKVDSVNVVEFRRITAQAGWEPRQAWMPAFQQADDFTMWLRQQGES